MRPCLAADPVPADPGGRYPGGFKFIKNFIPDEHNTSPQNWGIVQDRRGMIYSANQSGVLEYDGVSWRRIGVPNQYAMAVGVDARGTVYTAGYNEMGRLLVKAPGDLQYVSLLEHLDKRYHGFSWVYQIHRGGEGVWFRTPGRLFLWQGDGFTVFDSPVEGASFKALFSWKGATYIQVSKAGLFKAAGKSLQPVAGSGVFDKNKIAVAVPYDKERILIGMNTRGFYLFDGEKAARFTTGFDPYLKKHRLYHGIRLDDGNIALATLGGGLAIMDGQGKKTALYNEAAGLQDDNVKFLFQDNGGNLWLALDRGVSRIEWSSPFSTFDHRSNLKGQVFTVARHRGRLYAGSSSGLAVMETPPPHHLPQFRTVNGVTGNCWNLLDTGDALLAATHQGVFQVREEQVTAVVGDDTQTYVLTASRRFPDRVWAGTSKHLMVLRRESGNWKLEHTYTTLTEATIRTIAEEENGNLWLGTTGSGMARLVFKDDIKKPQSEWFTTKHKLPSGISQVVRVDRGVMFATPKGLYRFDQDRRTFVPDQKLGKELAGGEQNIYWLAQGQNLHIWFHSERYNFYAAPNADNTYTVDGTPFLRLPKSQVNLIFPEDRAVWFGLPKGLLRFNTILKKNYSYPFSAFIRNVKAGAGLTIYNGSKGGKTGAGDRTGEPELEYRRRNLDFEVAAPFFEDETRTEYQYFMDGFDRKWSDWTTKNWCGPAVFMIYGARKMLLPSGCSGPGTTPGGRIFVMHWRPSWWFS
jgi:ligand-binding sensor domain-containing protein